MTTNAQPNGAPAVMRPTNTRFLNSSPAASEFMERAAIASGARSLLADPDKIDDAEASAAALNSINTLGSAVATVIALNKDESRTAPQRNHVALKLADDVAGKIESDGEKIQRRATALFESGKDEAARAFAPDLSRQAYDALILQHIREQATKEDGLPALHELVKSNRNVASVIVNAEGFLLNLSPTVHDRLRDEAIATHAPEAWAKMLRGAALTDVPAKFKATAAKVRMYFADKLAAARMNSRVQGFD